MPVSAPERTPSGAREGEKMRFNKAVLGAILLAGTALAASAPAKAQVVQFEGYVGTDPYGADPNYVDPNYDPNYAQGYDPNYAQGYQDPGYDPYYSDQYAQGYGYDQGYDYGYGEVYDYDYADPNYYYAPT